MRIERRVRIGILAEQSAIKAGAQAQDVARFDLHLVRLHDPHQRVIADRHRLQPDMGEQINHHPARLQSRFGHALNPQRVRAVGAGLGFVSVQIIDRPANMAMRAVAVIIGHFLRAAARIIFIAHMAQRIPLGGILQGQRDAIIADDFLHARDHAAIGVVHHRIVAAHRKALFGRKAARVQLHTRAIEREREAEGNPLAHFLRGLAAVFGGDQVEAANLVIGAEVAPV